MRTVILLMTMLLLPVAVHAQTGKISGQVTSGSTGEALPGVNVVIDGTTQGAVSDIDGYYVILGVRPGTYSVRASFVGFTSQLAENIRVNIDLTTDLNFALRDETVGLDELVVSAERPVVQRDVSSSLVNISADEIENLPVASVADVIGLQAGFEPGLSVRGSGGDQVAMVVDGITFADPRGNQPFLGISYTSMEEVQVMTGGFNAEYGNVRSGLINVVTKDPGRTEYFADAIFRYTNAQQKYDGPVEDYGTFYKYPRLSSDVYTDADGNQCEISLCGTSILPQYLARQYEPFGGWNTLSEGTAWTPEQMRAAQNWYYRKDNAISKPDYEADATIGGPIPGGQALGNLRFTASFRQTQTAYSLWQQRESQDIRTFQGKMISDIGPGMKLVLSGMHSDESGFTQDNDSAQFLTAESPQYPWDSRNYLFTNDGNGWSNNGLFGDWTYSPSDINRQIYGAEFTHTLNATTFYTVQLQRNSSSTLTGAPEELRPTAADGSTAIARCITPDLQLREASTCADNEVPVSFAPFGFRNQYEVSDFGSFGSQGGDARDSTEVLRWSGKFDLTSQLNRFMLVKTGVEFLYSDYDVTHGSWDPANPHQENQRHKWSRSPVQGALYAQTKLEFRGMIANLGLRADYFHATGEWYSYTPFDRAFSALVGFNELETLPQDPTERQLSLSPRLGISFPVTETSKFYFNYGHFRQMLEARRLFGIQYRINSAISVIGNPNQPLPKTVAYELGYEQSFADQYLIRVAGYYRDLSQQPRNVTYISLDDLVNYARVEPLNYADNRGFELTLTKNRGQWIRGFINYTYLVRKGGDFGFGQIDENRRAFQEYANSPAALSSFKPVPEPFARFNLEVLIPPTFGPKVGNAHLLGDWRINFLGEWRKGAPSTWDGDQFSINNPGRDLRISYNLNWKDYKMLDLRFSKNFDVGFGRAQFFVDVTNVLNLRQMYNRNGNIFQGTDDARDYYRSLHLPAFDDIFVEGFTPGYSWVPGNDKPGDYRKTGVSFDPIFVDPDVADGVPDLVENALYYDLATERYVTYNNGAWGEADQGRVDQVLEDKAYIDMPNQSDMMFLNPRNVFFGVRLSF